MEFRRVLFRSAYVHFEQRLVAHEVHVGLDREPRGGQQPRKRDDIVAVESDPVRQLEPARDAAVALAFAVMVDEAAAPFPPQRRIVAARDQAGIFDRDHRLVIVAVERPGLNLALGALAAVQQTVERMQTVVAPRPDVAQLRLEFLRGHQLHSTISIPSSAISHPARSTWSRSGEPSTRIGLVLLMWM